MAMIIENEGTGLLFDNSEAKDRNDNAPDYTGQIKVGGEQYRVALWWKDFKSGEGFSASLQTTEGNYAGKSSEEGEEEEPRGRSRRGTKSTGKTYKKPTRR